MNEFLKEILSQPQALMDTFKYSCQNKAHFQRFNDLFKEREISKILFTGMGSSYYCSFVPYYLLNQRGINAETREAGEFLFYSLPKNEINWFTKSIVILISQSGESGETVQLLNKINALKNPPITIGITNSPKSTLALNTNLTFLIKAGEEKSVTSKSYTCSLLLLYILAINLVNNFFSSNKDLKEVENTIKEVDNFLKDSEKIEIFYNNLLSFYGKDVDFLEILARGPSLATANQAALNAKEIVKINSEASSCSTFHHGGIESLNKNSKLVIISSEEYNFNLNLHFMKNILTNWECGKILHITNCEPYQPSDYTILRENAKFISFKHNVINPFLSPIMEIVMLQLFFYKMAEKRAITPGKFNFTQKITRDI